MKLLIILLIVHLKLSRSRSFLEFASDGDDPIKTKQDTIYKIFFNLFFNWPL